MRETMDEAIIRLLWQRLVLAGGWHPEVLLDSLADDISPETLARSSAALMAISPSLDAGSDDRAPRKEPTGVRAAETMTTSVMGFHSLENNSA